MTRDGRPGTLHPGGFGHVPIALQRDPRSSAGHIDVYAAISGTLAFSSGEGEVRRRRIVERSKRKAHTVIRVVADLVSWGYIEPLERPGRPTLYRLLPTGPVDIRQERRKDALASDPRRTGQVGGKAKGRAPEGSTLPGHGSMPKGRAVSGTAPQSEETHPDHIEAIRRALAAAFRYDPGHITRTPKGWLTRAAKDIHAVNGVPCEVRFRFEAFEERTGRRPTKPIDIANEWPRLDCERARRARDLRESLSLAYGEAADGLVASALDALPSEEDVELLARWIDQEGDRA